MDREHLYQALHPSNRDNLFYEVEQRFVFSKSSPVDILEDQIHLNTYTCFADGEHM